MTTEQLRKTVEDKGHVWFYDKSKKGYDVNIIGIRNLSTGKKVTNVFDDELHLVYNDEQGNTQHHSFAITTDPGKKGVQQFSNKKGVFRLKPGQYRSTYAIDKHQGKYEALCQRLKPVTGWRDNNRDLTYDEHTLDTGMFGINIHKAGTDSTWVENWSEGCQVFKRVKDFDQFMAVIKKAAKIWGNKFTYTLIEK